MNVRRSYFRQFQETEGKGQSAVASRLSPVVSDFEFSYIIYYYPKE